MQTMHACASHKPEYPGIHAQRHTCVEGLAEVGAGVAAAATAVFCTSFKILISAQITR
jgi:hypothetical protein